MGILKNISLFVLALIALFGFASEHDSLKEYKPTYKFEGDIFNNGDRYAILIFTDTLKEKFDLKFLKKGLKSWTLENEFKKINTWAFHENPRLTDFNLDGQNDFMISREASGRGSNNGDHLFIFNKSTGELDKIRGFDHLCEARYDKKKSEIFSLCLTSGEHYRTYKIIKDSVVLISGETHWIENNFQYNNKFIVKNGERKEIFRDSLNLGSLELGNNEKE